MALGDWLRNPEYIKAKAAADDARLAYYNEIGGVPTTGGIVPLAPEQKAQAEAIAARSAPQGINTDVRAAVQPAYSPGFIPLPGPAPFIPYFQQAQPAPTPAPAPRPTGQFIYNQYRRPAPPRMMFEGLPSLLERFRMQPSAQQYPMPPRFRFAGGGEASNQESYDREEIDRVIDETRARHANEALQEKINLYQHRLISLDELASYMPGVDPFYIAEMFGGTDSNPLDKAKPGDIQTLPYSPPKEKSIEEMDLDELAKRGKGRTEEEPNTSRIPDVRPLGELGAYDVFSSPKPSYTPNVNMPQGSDALNMFLKNRRMI